MQIVILAHMDDVTALCVGAILRAHHRGDVKMVSAEELVFAPRWMHRLDGPAVSTELRLSDGSMLASDALSLVFNRLRYVDLPHFAGATPADQNYAIAETYAFWLSWLASLPCPVVNPATPRGLGLQERSHIEWLALAGQAGLPTRGYQVVSDPRLFPRHGALPYRRLPAPAPDGTNLYEPLAPLPASRRPTVFLEEVAEQRQHALIAGSTVVGTPDDTLCAPMRRLAALAGCDLLRVWFARSTIDGGWKVCEVSSFPRAESRDEIEAIAALLTAKRATAEVPR